MIALSFCGLALSTYLLLTDFSFYASQLGSPSRYETVAVTRDIISQVRRRSATVPVWDSVSDGDTIQSRDQVFTDKDSSTVLEFTDGSQIKLGENTLIRVEKGADKTRFDVVRGDFIAQGAENGIPVEINVQGIKTVLAGKKSAVQVKTNSAGATSITVVEGQAKITAKGKTLDVHKNQQGRFAEDGSLTALRKIPFVLLMPSDNEVIFTDSRSTKQQAGIEFSWEKIEGLSKYQIELSPDPKFRKAVSRKESDLPIVFVNLPVGTYHWRISGVQQGSKVREYSVERLLRVVEDRAPALSSPRPNEVFQYRERLVEKDLDSDSEPEKEGALVRFSWERLKVPVYEFELADHRGFQNPIAKEELAESSWIPPALPEGRYQWRVRVVAEDRPLSPWSESRTFEVKKVPLPRVIASESATTKFVLSNKKKTVPLRWRENVLARGYEWELARDSEFEEVVDKGNAKIGIHEWQPKALGSYYWRVRPLDMYGRNTAPSAPQSIEVGAEPAGLVSPAPEMALSLPDLQGRLKFSWTPVPLATGYKVQVSADRDFEENVWESETKTLETQWNNPQAGRFYWRVLATVPGSELVGSSAGKIELLDIPLPDAPVLQPEYEIDLESRKEPFDPGPAEHHSWWHIFLSEAYAAPAPKRITYIRWRSTGPKNSYYLELAQDPEFSKVIVKKKLDTPEFLWPDLKPGKFYVRVASIDVYNRRSDFSNTSVLLIRPRPPSLSGPSGKFNYREGDGKKMRFNWAKVRAATAYTFEVAANKDFQKPIFQTTTTDLKVVTEPFEDGKYYWRVKAKIGPELETRYTDAQTFQVAMLEPLPPPPPQFDVAFEWKTLPQANRYALQISKTQDFKTIVVKSSPHKALYHGQLPEGNYYWRVAGVSKGVQGPWSEPALLRVPTPANDPSLANAGTTLSVDEEDAVVEAQEGKDAEKALRRGVASARDPGGGGPPTTKSQTTFERASIPIEVWATYRPAINDFAQTSTDPAASFQGINVVSFAAGAGVEWKKDTLATEVLYQGQARTLFQLGQVGIDQEPIPTFRHDIQVGTFYRFPINESFTLKAGLGYRYMNVLSFRTLTSTSLQKVVSHTHGALAELRADYRLSPRFLLGARLGYSYPLLKSNSITLSSPFNLFTEVSAAYELFPNFTMLLSYSLQLNQYNYVDNNDPLTGGPVIGTLSDNNQFVSLSFGYRFNL